MKRTAIKRSPRKPRPPEGPLAPREWYDVAMKAANWRSQLSGARVNRVTGHVHHVLPKRWLRANGYPHLVWDPANAMVLTAAEHEAHENGSERLPFSALPDCALRFAADIGDPALVEIERHSEGGL